MPTADYLKQVDPMTLSELEAVVKYIIAQINNDTPQISTDTKVGYITQGKFNSRIQMLKLDSEQHPKQKEW